MELRNFIENAVRRYLIENYNNTYNDYLIDIANHINEVIDYYDQTEVKPLKLYLFGSRIKGNNRKNSDLDVLFIYQGTLRSKYLQDSLNQDLNRIDNIKIDISPVNEDEEYFLNKFYTEYDITKLPTHNF